MLLLGSVATVAQKAHFLAPMVAGNARSAFLMTEPAAEGGAGSDPSMLQTVAVQQGGEWVISGRKAFATGFAGAKRSEEHTSELQSLMRISYAVFCLKKKKTKPTDTTTTSTRSI